MITQTFLNQTNHLRTIQAPEFIAPISNYASESQDGPVWWKATSCQRNHPSVLTTQDCFRWIIFYKRISEALERSHLIRKIIWILISAISSSSRIFLLQLTKLQSSCPLWTKQNLNHQYNCSTRLHVICIGKWWTAKSRSRFAVAA